MTLKQPTSGEIASLVQAGGVLPSGAQLCTSPDQAYYQKMMAATVLLDRASAGDFRVEKDAGAELTVWVCQGRAAIDGVVLALAGGVAVDLSAHDDDTAYVWLYDDEGAPGIGAGADGDGWPMTAHIRLAEVTLAGGVITGIVDRRKEVMLRADSAAAALASLGITAGAADFNALTEGEGDPINIYVADPTDDTHAASKGYVDGRTWERAALAEEALRSYALDLRHVNGEALDAVGGTGVFHVSAGGWGSGTVVLETEQVSNAAASFDLSAEIMLPPEYVAGGDVQIAVHAKADGGTVVLRTLDAEVYELGADGGVGADLCTTAAQTLTAADAEYVFVVTATNLLPGDRLRVLVRVALEEGGSGNMVATVGLARLLADVRG